MAAIFPHSLVFSKCKHGLKRDHSNKIKNILSFVELQKDFRQTDSLVDYLLSLWKKHVGSEQWLKVRSHWQFFSEFSQSESCHFNRNSHNLETYMRAKYSPHRFNTDSSWSLHYWQPRQWAIFACKISPKFHNYDHILRLSVHNILPNISFCVRKSHTGLEKKLATFLGELMLL